MRFSESWLRGFLSPEPELDTWQLADRLTMLGLEVDAVEPAGRLHDLIVVAQVTSIEPLGGNIRAHACQVSVGDGLPDIGIVCGAPNLKPGMKAALARPGAEIVSGRVEARELHGLVSQGMLVSEAEIGLGEDADEIIELDESSPLGTPLAEALGLDDHCISLDLTPDRGDCLGLIGIARDLAASLGAELKMPQFEVPSASIDDRVPVRLEAPEACARFLSSVCKGLSASARTPMWLRERLRRSGLRSIHPAVDITNYVMLELGRPLHAFDLDKVSQALVVRHGRPGEKLLLLDGKEVTLSPEMLAVCDVRGPLSLAGIMGDATSAVTRETRDVVFECAWFEPRSLGRSARRLALQTDSSTRFERGVDPSLMALGMDRARQLIAEICGARLGPVSEAESAQHLPQRSARRLRRSQVKRLIGQDIDADFIEDRLARLGFASKRSNESSWNVEVPSHRFDIEGEADLVEEVARMHGYEKVRDVPCESMGRPARAQTSARRLREFAAALGYREVISYSFLPAKSMEMVAHRDELVRLLNPMSSDQAVMRCSLLPGLLRVLASNLARQHTRARLFELGRVFLQKDAELEAQPMHLAALHCGEVWPDAWAQDKREVDFFDVKGDVERLLAFCGHNPADIEWQPSSDTLCHPGRGATLMLDGQRAGLVGELHPNRRRQLEIEQPVCFFELAVEALSRCPRAKFEEPSRFPQIRRDIAVLVKRDLPTSNLLAAVREVGDELLRESDVFDVYQGSGIEESDKSVAIRLIFQTSGRTLRDEEVSVRLERILDTLRRRYNARLRGA